MKPIFIAVVLFITRCSAITEKYAIDESEQTNFDINVDTTVDTTGANTTWSFQGCDHLYVPPEEKNLTRSAGQSVNFSCICEIHDDYGEHRPPHCPEWTSDYDNVTNNQHHRRCTVTMNIARVTLNTAKRFVCSDNISGKEAVAYLNVEGKSYDEYCEGDDDCRSPFKCYESNCDCPDSKPIYIDCENSTSNCYSPRRLLRSCSYKVQCLGSDRNSYCHGGNNADSDKGICLCRPGYEIEDGRCANTQSTVGYVYRLSKPHQFLFYVLLALALALICIGIAKFFMVYKQKNFARRRSLRPVYIGTPNLDTQLSIDKEQLRY